MKSFHLILITRVLIFAIFFAFISNLYSIVLSSSYLNSHHNAQKLSETEIDPAVDPGLHLVIETEMEIEIEMMTERGAVGEVEVVVTVALKMM